MDRFAEMELFVQVAESGSLTRAAENLEMSMSAASRYLVSLETRLGVRLVQRTTRKLYLTEAGSEFYRRSKAVLADMREAEAIVTEATVNPTGLLRISASLSFCLLHIEPLLPEFTAKYPDISIDLVAANRYYDLIENGVDVAIRTRSMEADSNITIRRLAETRRVLVASPKYIKQNGRPKSPQELHNFHVLNYVLADHYRELLFKRGEETEAVRVKALLDSNDGQILVKAGLDGMGIVVQPKYIVCDEIESGRLVPVLDEWDLPRLTINIAFQTRVHMPAKVRLFIEALVSRFHKHQFEKRWTS